MAHVADDTNAHVADMNDQGHEIDSEKGEKAPGATDSTFTRHTTPDRSQESINHHETSEEHQPEESYLHGAKLISIIVAICLAVFCVALDNTIIVTAIPSITNYFQTLQDAGWYGSSYLMTTCGFQLFFGKLFGSYSHKWVFLLGFAFFELGSLLCGAATTSAMFIIGRAIAGLGGAGVLSGAFIIIAEAVSIKRRANFSALIWAMYGIASCSGPLVGGVFTEQVTWRWCFYLNLPIGGVTAVVLLFFLKSEKPATAKPYTSWRHRILDLDPLGNTLFITAVICLLLALQYGGITWPWGSGRIIALFVLFGVLMIGFGVLQVYLGDAATWPKRVAVQRSMVFGSIFSFCLGASYLVFAFYIPYYLQAIRNFSPLLAGVGILPLILGQVGGNLLSGVVITKIGYYVPFMWLSVVFMAVGSGLLTTLTRTSSIGHWVGYQIIDGVGIGFGWQIGALAAQAVLDSMDIPVGTAIAVFMLLFGGAVFVSVANSIFTNGLVNGLAAANIQGVDPNAVVHLGATQLRQLVSGDELEAVLDSYMGALTDVYRLGLILACICAVGCVGMEWVNIRKLGIKAGGGAA